MTRRGYQRPYIVEVWQSMMPSYESMYCSTNPSMFGRIYRNLLKWLYFCLSVRLTVCLSVQYTHTYSKLCQTCGQRKNKPGCEHINRNPPPFPIYSRWFELWTPIHSLRDWFVIWHRMQQFEIFTFAVWLQRSRSKTMQSIRLRRRQRGLEVLHFWMHSWLCSVLCLTS